MSHKTNKCFIEHCRDDNSYVMYTLFGSPYTILHLVSLKFKHNNKFEIITSHKFRELLNFKEMSGDERKGYYQKYSSIQEVKGFVVNNLKKNGYYVIGSEYLIYE